MCQILIPNAINTKVTDMEGNIRIDRLTLGRGTDSETDVTSPLAGAISFPLVVPLPLGSFYILILPYLSVTII
jgi:hypothetical protein